VPNAIAPTDSIPSNGTRNPGNVPEVLISQPVGGNEPRPVTPTLSAARAQLQSQNGVAVSPNKQLPQPQEPRRFYFSRSPSTPGIQRGNSIAQARSSPKVFMEKRPTRITKEALHASLSKQNSSESLRNTTTSQGDSAESTASLTTLSPKKPSPALRSQAPLRNTKLPSGKVVPWNATAAQLSSEMQAFTMREIGQNIAAASKPTEPISQIPFTARKSSSKFKPNPPPPRYLDRHPEEAAAVAAAAATSKKESEDQAMLDIANDDSSGYVMDTYIRMPIEGFEPGEATKNFGLLVLDNQPDIDEFYNDDSDDDSEIYDEEEDENGTFSDSWLSTLTDSYSRKPSIYRLSRRRNRLRRRVWSKPVPLSQQKYFR
jgi:hypothetical protein